MKSYNDLGLPLRPSITRATLGASGPFLRGIASHDNVNVAWITLSAPNAVERMAHLIKAANLYNDLIEALTGLDNDAGDGPCFDRCAEHGRRAHSAACKKAQDVLIKAKEAS